MGWIKKPQSYSYINKKAAFFKRIKAAF